MVGFPFSFEAFFLSNTGEGEVGYQDEDEYKQVPKE